MIKITPQELKTIAAYIYKISGISLDESKAYLLETRLSGLLSELNCTTYGGLQHKAASDPTKTLDRRIIDAISTGETMFFRDQSPFELLQHKILPDLIDTKRSRLPKSAPVSIRIWCAACSTGQEVYSVAIVLKELLGVLSGFDVKLLGTDLSDSAVARASLGEYNKFEIGRGLSQEKLLKYFNSVNGAWKVKDEIRGLATFKRYNLMESLTGLGRFDVILCRNVAIYFTLEDRVKLFGKIADILTQEGSLIIGASEFLTGICSRLEPKRYLRSVFYQLNSK